MLLVRDWMTREVATLGPEASVAEALALCQEKRIRHIPILDDGRLVGLVSDRDLRDASPAPGDPDRESAQKETRVGDVMNRDVITAGPQDPIGHAAQVMYERKIESLPVVSEAPTASTVEAPAAEEEELMGIITSSDVMQALVTLTGIHEPGSQIEVQVPDRPGGLVEVVNNIGNLGEEVLSILASPERLAGHRTLVFRLVTSDPSHVAESLERDGYPANKTP